VIEVLAVVHANVAAVVPMEMAGNQSIIKMIVAESV
jgi:hypothetical protein